MPAALDKEFPCNGGILLHEFGNFKLGMEGHNYTTPEEPACFVVPFKEFDSPEVFYATLESMYNGTWIRDQALELQFSYTICVKIWLIGNFYDIDAMRSIAMNSTFKLTKSIMKTDKAWPINKERQMTKNARMAKKAKNKAKAMVVEKTKDAHLISFVRAVKLAQKYKWHHKLWKELYDCGADLALKLRNAPAFKHWVKESQDGADFARAVSI